MAGPGDEEPRKRRDEPPPLEFLKPGDSGLAPPPERPAAWVTRPEDFERSPPTAPYPMPPARAARGRSLAAGVLLVLAGVVGMVTTYVLFITPLSPEEQQQIENFTADQEALAAGLTIVLINSQAVSVLGGVMALQRRNWKLATACAALALLGMGYSLLVGVLNLVGLLLLVTARREFVA
jgi:predicted ABC-type sugar transport system permease subunit